MTKYRYRLFGLGIESDIPIPDLPIISENFPIDVVISGEPIPDAEQHEPAGLHVSRYGAILNIPDVGRYLIKGGNQIRVEPAPAATSRNIRLYLLGSAFGAILHQRHMLPLHANVIDFDGVAVAFMGHSGAGKSTLASWFHDRGYSILGDDVCVLNSDDQSRPIVEAGLPRMRLWGDALQASGRTPSDYEASFDDVDKYDVPTAAASPPKPLRLAAIYDLQSVGCQLPSSITRLTGIDAVQALVANTYRGAFVPMLGEVKTHLDQCISLSRQVPVFELQRRWGLDVLAEEGAFIEAHVRELLAG